MKKFFTLILFTTMLAMNGAFAQSSSIISLNHEGTITTYTDFSAAYTAAKAGDVITLSEGSWTIIKEAQGEFTFNKKITIRGAGMYKTTLSGYSGGGILHIYPNITFEGISFSSFYNINYHPTSGIIKFSKCSLYPSYFSSPEGSGGAIHFYNCSVNYLTCPAEVRVTCINCNVYSPKVTSVSSSFNCINCYVNFDSHYSYNSDLGPATMSYSTFENCILYYKFYDNEYAKRYFPETVKATHNLAQYNMFYNKGDNYVPNVTEDEELEEYFINNNIRNLTDKAKTMFLGTDGTVVGVEGGLLPWSTITSVPRISKFNVAEKVLDNKLSVDISVNDAE